MSVSLSHRCVANKQDKATYLYLNSKTENFLQLHFFKYLTSFNKLPRRLKMGSLIQEATATTEHGKGQMCAASLPHAKRLFPISNLRTCTSALQPVVYYDSCRIPLK